MKLNRLIKDIKVLKTSNFDPDVNVKGVDVNSKKIKDAYIFVAVKGPNHDGHKYIAEAVKLGASVVILQDHKFLPKAETSVVYLLVRDSMLALSKIASVFYGNPYSKLKFIGVTGTNGKTTVVYLIRSILKNSGIKCASIGTLGYKVGVRNKELHNTTPGLLDLYRLAKEAVDAGNTHLVMEVSSHALDQERVAGISFQQVVFTNLSQDHLDYHRTKEEYFNAKKKLFKNYTSPQSCAIVNKDDEYSESLMSEIYYKIMTFGFREDVDVRALYFRFEQNKSSILIQTPFGPLSLETDLIGKHNVYNILAAVSAAVSMDLKLEKIKKGIEEVKSIPGRLQRLDTGGLFNIFIDYAHTEDALKNVLESLRSVVDNGRIITVFGCGGDRDSDKRPKMGNVAASLSDYCIITSDNPRSEDPEAIVNDIIRGIDRDNYEVQIDRRAAIKKALLMAGKNDFVLIAGKGHETTQRLKKKVLVFDDSKVALELVYEMR